MPSSLPGFEMQVHNPSDVVYTPDWCASDIVKYFQPSGRILEPCAGDGAFLRYLPTAEWCEITKGKDFFRWHEQVDWIVTNPPYSVLREFVIHGFKVAQNAVYLVPLKNLFTAHGFMADCWQYGWLKHVRVYGTGSKLNFPMGNAVGAMHFERGYWGGTSWSWYATQHRLHLDAGDSPALRALSTPDILSTAGADTTPAPRQ